MTNKFLGTTISSELGDGTVIIIGSTLSASNLNPSQALKTDALKRLVSTDLAISDITNLQASLDANSFQRVGNDVQFKSGAYKMAVDTYKSNNGTDDIVVENTIDAQDGLKMTNKVSKVSIDGSFTEDLDSNIVSEKAIKLYVDTTSSGDITTHESTYNHTNISLNSAHRADTTGVDHSILVSTVGLNTNHKNDITGASHSTLVSNVGLNTTHRGDITGADHSTLVSNVGSNTSHRNDATGASHSTLVSNVGSNTSHRNDVTGASHSTLVSDVGLNTTHKNDVTGASHSTLVSNVGLNTTHRGDTYGTSHSNLVYDVSQNTNHQYDTAGTSHSGLVSNVGSNTIHRQDVNGSSHTTLVSNVGSNTSHRNDVTGASHSTLVSDVGLNTTYRTKGFIGFGAYLSTSLTNVTGDNTDYIIIFNSEEYDIGSNYNTTTGQFVAPETGYYHFTCTLSIADITNLHDSGRIYFRKLTTGGSLDTTYTVHDTTFTDIRNANTDVILTVSADMYLAVGQRAEVMINVAAGTKVIDIIALNKITRFSGFLIK